MGSIFAFARAYGAKLWLSFLIIFSIWFGLNQRAEMARIWDLLLNSDEEWLFALVGIEIAILTLIAASYRSLLSGLGHRVKLDILIGVHLKRVVVGTISPVGGPPSMAIFVHALRRRGVRPADALLAISLKSVIGNVAFLFLLLPVLLVQKPSMALIICTIALVVIVLAMSGALVLVLRSAKPPRWFLKRLPRMGLKFVAQARRHDVHLRSLLTPFAMVLATKVAGVVMLFVSLHAVGNSPDINVPLVAYVVGMVFMLVAPVFQGIGFVEVGMAVALQKLGVPAPAAVGATLLCRAGELWLPLLSGIAFQTYESVSEHMRRTAPVPQAIP